MINDDDGYCIYYFHAVKNNQIKININYFAGEYRGSGSS